MSRETDYNSEDGATICAGLAEGRSLLSICEAMGIPVSTAWGWERSIPEHSENAARAREVGCHVMACETLDIADTPQLGEIRTIKPDGAVEVRYEDMTQHRRLRIDTRKWLLAKWANKIYGERTTVAGDPDAPLVQQLTDEQLAARIAALQARLTSGKP